MWRAHKSACRRSTQPRRTFLMHSENRTSRTSSSGSIEKRSTVEEATSSASSSSSVSESVSGSVITDSQPSPG